MQQLDDWIIDKIFQPISVWCQTHLGITNFAITRLLLSASSVAIIAFCWLINTEPEETYPVATFFCLLFSLYSLHRLFEKTDRIENAYLRTDSPKINPTRKEFAVRINGLIWTLIATAVGEHNVADVALLIYVYTLLLSLYFLACSPLPPQRKLIESLA